MVKLKKAVKTRKTDDECFLVSKRAGQYFVVKGRRLHFLQKMG